MIQSARASYIRSFYVCQCRVFEEWYARAQKIPFQCSVCAILSFQQPLVWQFMKMCTENVAHVQVQVHLMGSGCGAVSPQQSTFFEPLAHRH